MAAVEEDEVRGDQALPELHRPEDFVGTDDHPVAVRALGLLVEAPVRRDVDDPVVLPEELVEHACGLIGARLRAVVEDAPAVDVEPGFAERVGDERRLLDGAGQTGQEAGWVPDDERVVGHGAQDLAGSVERTWLELPQESGAQRERPAAPTRGVPAGDHLPRDPRRRLVDEQVQVVEGLQLELGFVREQQLEERVVGLRVGVLILDGGAYVAVDLAEHDIHLEVAGLCPPAHARRT